MDIPTFVEWIKGIEIEDLTQNDFDPKVIWFEEGEEKALARLTMMPRINGDWIAALPRPLAMLTAAQENAAHIAVISDSMGTMSATRHDGTAWGPGGMQYALLNKTVDADLVHECLMVLFVSADGTISQATIPYERHDEGLITYGETKVHTTSPDDPESQAQTTGRLPEMLTWAFSQPKLVDAMPGIAEALGLNPTERAAHTLSIAVKMVMQDYGWLCMIGAATEEEQELLKHSFNEGPLSEGIRSFDQDEIQEIVHLEDAFALPDFERS